MRNEGVLKNGMGSENAWFPWQPIADLRMGVCLQSNHISAVTYPRQHNTKLKLRHRPINSFGLT